MFSAIARFVSVRLAWCVCIALGLLDTTLAERSEWSAADRAQLRLLLVPGPTRTTLAGGVEIVLEQDWYTYWRNPGDAGVAPEFDFSASQNLASVEVLYPAPERHDDGASVSLIYPDEIVFPLVVTPVDPAQPVTLHLKARFGVCREVCIPTQASAAVTFSLPAVPDPLADARLSRFKPRVPKAPEPGRFDVEAVTLLEEALLIDLRVPDSASADLFSEAPKGWYLGQPSLVSRQDGVSRYKLSLSGRPKNAIPQGRTFRFVATTGEEAIEESILVH